MELELVFVDTSAFKALMDENDNFYGKAMRLWDQLESERIALITSNYVIDETLTLLRYKVDLKVAIDFHEEFLPSTNDLTVIRISTQDETNAWQWFKNNWSKLSYTDCVSFAMMKRLGITRVFTFDEHFKRAGFEVEKNN